mgnify:CR=1 FL=1
MAKKTTTPVTTIYTNENCGYCKTMKDKFNEKEVKFIEKERSKNISEWNEVSRLTGLPTFPTLEFNGGYYIPGRDFNNPDQIVDYIKEWNSDDNLKQNSDIVLLEAFKTLTFTLTMSLNRLQQELQQIKQQINGDESNN